MTPPAPGDRERDDSAPADRRDEPGRDRSALGPESSEPPESIPLTETEAIKSLTGSVPPDRGDLAQALGIIGRIVDRFGAVPSLRIGSVTVFNDEVTVEEGGFAIGGGAVGTGRGDGRRRFSATALTAEVLERQIGSFVKPPGYLRAQRILEREHLVVLSASAGTGRETCALALLNEVADRARLHFVGPDLRATEDFWRAGKPGGGYIAGDVDPAVMAGIDDTWLRGAAKALTDSGGYLVVVTGPLSTGSPRGATAAEFVVDDLGCPDPLAVLRRRARAATRPGRAAALDGALADPELAELLVEEKSPRFAARGATALADAVNRGADPANVVTALCDPAVRVRAWFDHTDVADAASDQEIALAVAAAVLDGCSYLTVTDAAIALYDRLHRGASKIRFRRSLRANQPWLQTFVPDGPASIHDDPTPETLCFRSPRVQAIVLGYVWTELDGLRPALITWLRGLANHSDVDVRACTSASAGLLATLDFAYAVRHLLRPWATSPSPAVRGCAALALSVPSRDPQYAKRVWALLREWAGDRTPRIGNRLSWTAAEAVSSIAGDESPDRALEVLHEVLERDDWDCLVAMSLGLLNLVEGGHAARALGALLDWSEDQDESAHVVKTLATFVTTARTPVVTPTPHPAAPPTPTPRTPTAASPGTTSRSSRLITTRIDGSKKILSGDHRPTPTTGIAATGTAAAASALPGIRPTPASVGEPWPFLLREADRHRSDLRDLWARALACKPVRPVALTGLRSWLDLADRDAAALPKVTALAQALSDLGGKHRDRVLYHLEQWAAHPREPSKAAERVLALIRSEGR